jgi:CubicO group peptidase (beta-lactamase class C family)
MVACDQRSSRLGLLRPVVTEACQRGTLGLGVDQPKRWSNGLVGAGGGGGRPDQARDDGGHSAPGVESRLRRLMASRVPGLSVAVVRAAGVRWRCGLGLADLATRASATSDTIYLWFSMTKIVTATAVVQLADRAGWRWTTRSPTTIPGSPPCARWTGRPGSRSATCSATAAAWPTRSRSVGSIPPTSPLPIPPPWSTVC